MDYVALGHQYYNALVLTKRAKEDFDRKAEAWNSWQDAESVITGKTMSTVEQAKAWQELIVAQRLYLQRKAYEDRIYDQLKTMPTRG